MISCGAKEDSLQEVKDVDQVKKDQKKTQYFTNTMDKERIFCP